jgi:hypothetical protein
MVFSFYPSPDCGRDRNGKPEARGNVRGRT